MVSQPADHTSSTSSGSLTPHHRGGGLPQLTSKSVVGTASTTGQRSRRRDSRHHHYNRSYAGGTSYVPQNEFPWFSHSGDVEIIVKVPSGHGNRYLLHRHTLTRCSGFFEASTSEPWSRATDVAGDLPALPAPPPAASTRSSELARIGEENSSSASGGSNGPGTVARIGPPRKRWRYELDCGASGDDIPMLVQKEESSSSNSAADNIAATRGITSPTSIFGGPVTTSSTTSSSGRKQSHSHSSRDFFRSVANLSLHHSSSSAGHNYLPPTSTTTTTTTTTPNLPPPSQEDQDILRDYDNLFRVMYNFSPVLDGINIADAYVQCKSLLTLADQYDALAVVGPRVDHHLLQFQSRLWKQIAKYPISYLRLGYLARSKIIFSEALIHVVGQWPAGERSLRASLPESVLDIIEDKVDELEENVARVEGRLFRLNLTTRSGERVSPGTNFLDWMAVSLFRQWLADNTTPAPNPPPPPPPSTTSHSHHHNDRHRSLTANTHRTRTNPPPTSTPATPSTVLVRTGSNALALPVIPPLSTLGRTYRTLGHPTGAGFLGHDECKRFLKLTPELYSRDNLRRFEKRVDELKALAREVVRPLMGSGLELDLQGGSRAAEGIGYLTCTKVTDRDIPWSGGD